jgi:hypothetical protein
MAGIEWACNSSRVQIAWAIPCRYAEELSGLGNFLGAGLDVFRPSGLPAQIRVALAVNLVVPEYELGTDEEITVEVLDPSMNVAPGPTLNVRLDDYASRPAGRRPSTMAVVIVELTAPEYGQYTVNLRLQDRVTPVTLFVERRSDGGEAYSLPNRARV